MEELARQADVSVDTIRFYQKRRLLAAPTRAGRIGWYGPDHLERLARIRDLQDQGFSLAIIRRLLDGELDPADVPLAAAVVEAEAGQLGTNESGTGNSLTIDELAAHAGIPRSILETATYEGLLVPHRVDGEPRYTAADAQLVSAGVRLLETGLPMTELLALARRHHKASRAIAEDAVEMFDEHVRKPLRDAELTDSERAKRLVDAFHTLLPTATALVGNHFRRVLLEVAQEHLEAVGETIELDAASQRESETR